MSTTAKHFETEKRGRRGMTPPEVSCWSPPRPIPPPAIAPLAVSIPEAGRAMSCCSRTIREMVKRGELRAVKCGRRTVIPVSELHRLVGSEVAT